jgi:hypothetical protein
MASTVQTNAVGSAGLFDDVGWSPCPFVAVVSGEEEERSSGRGELRVSDPQLALFEGTTDQSFLSSFAECFSPFLCKVITS